MPTTPPTCNYVLRYAHIPVVDINHHRLTLNQAYATKKVKHYAAFIDKHAATTEFYQNLLTSVEEQGIRNPIVLVYIIGHIFLRYGGSRLWAARKLELETIPAIVLDFVGGDRFGQCPELATEDDIRGTFSEQPAELHWGDNDFFYNGLPTRS